MGRNKPDSAPLAVAYARVSSKEQEKEGYSVPAQQKLLAAYAAENGIAVLREFVDVETAKPAGRSAFGEMLQYLRKARSCRAILVEKTDRLYRNFKDDVLLDELDVELHFVKEGTVLSRDSRSGEKFAHGIKVLMAKNYTDNLSEETRKGMAEKAAQGGVPDPVPARLPERDRDGREEDDRAGPGLRPARAAAVRAVRHRHLLAQRAGGAGPRRRVRLQGEQEAGLPGGGPQAADQQAILRKRNQQKTRKGTRTFAFSRLLSCGHCGCALAGEEKKGRYTYYHCTGFKGKCPEPFVREEVWHQTTR